jgi:hypothetical protein
LIHTLARSFYVAFKLRCIHNSIQCLTDSLPIVSYTIVARQAVKCIGSVPSIAANFMQMQPRALKIPLVALRLLGSALVRPCQVGTVPGVVWGLSPAGRLRELNSIVAGSMAAARAVAASLQSYVSALKSSMPQLRARGGVRCHAQDSRTAHRPRGQCP